MKEQSQHNEQAILDSFTIREIVDILTEIDQKILSLHECSSNDFLALNSHFKKYFKISQSISNNARQILNVVLSNSEDSELFTYLDTSKSKIKYYLETFSSKSLQVISDLEKILNLLNQLFVPLNNYMQDMMTLKLLIANLELHHNENAIKQKNKLIINDVLKLITDGNSLFIDFQIELNNLKIDIATSINNLQELRNENSSDVETLMEQIQLSENMLLEKQQEAVAKLPILREKTDNTSQSIEKIITNLQYHDIIRQKIGHIQQTHQDIINNLLTIDNRDKTRINQIEEKIETYQKIRDIAGLQAAQMLHANKEYQRAIGIITEKLTEIGDDMINISALCLIFAGTTNKSHESHFIRINNALEKSKNKPEAFLKNNCFFKNQVTSALVQIERIANYINQLDGINNKIQNLFNENCKTEIKQQFNNADYILGQICSLCGDMHRTNISLQQCFHEAFEMGEEINLSINRFCFDGKVDDNLNTIALNLQQIVAKLNENNKQVYTLLVQNRELSINVSSEIKSSIDDVKYYDFFKKTIDDVIDQLYFINFKLNADQTISAEERAKNIEFIKEKYTMESEHLIHEQITNTSSSILKEKETDQNNENNDNVELF